MGESIDPELFAIDSTAIRTNQLKSDKGYALGEVYANPGNSRMMIDFELPHETFVSLKVCSMLGKEIAEVTGASYSSGRHTVEFDSKNMAEGMYLISIKTGEFSASRKMIVPAN